MSGETKTTGGGVGFFGLLGLLFIGLKLGGVIDWSWWFMLMPLYGPICIALAILMVICLAILVFKLFDR